MSAVYAAIDEYLTRIRGYHKARSEADQAFLAAQSAKHSIFQVMGLTVGPSIHDAKVDREISKRGTLMAKEAEARGAMNEMDLIDLIEREA